MALESFFEQFLMLNKTSEPDAYGGQVETYTDGDLFLAAVALDSSTEAQIAERSGMKKLYSLIVPKKVRLFQHDRVKRLKTGEIMRIMGNTDDMQTPAMSELNCSAVSAEVVE